MTMGETLKKLRLEKGLTLQEVGDVIGVHKATIAKYEKGETSNMKRSNIQKLTSFYKVSPSYLMGFTEERNSEADALEEDILKRFRQLSNADKITAYRAFDEIFKHFEK